MSKLLTFLRYTNELTKRAFQPMPAGQMDPSAMGAAPVPGGDPSAMGGAPGMPGQMPMPQGAPGGAPGMDPNAAMGGQGMVDPATGLPVDPNTGMPIDPSTGQPIDPVMLQQAMGGAGGGEPEQPPLTVSQMTLQDLKTFMKGVVSEIIDKTNKDKGPTADKRDETSTSSVDAKLDAIMQAITPQQAEPQQGMEAQASAKTGLADLILSRVKRVK